MSIAIEPDSLTMQLENVKETIQKTIALFEGYKLKKMSDIIMRKARTTKVRNGLLRTARNTIQRRVLEKNTLEKERLDRERPALEKERQLTLAMEPKYVESTIRNRDESINSFVETFINRYIDEQIGIKAYNDYTNRMIIQSLDVNFMAGMYSQLIWFIQKHLKDTRRVLPQEDKKIYIEIICVYLLFCSNIANYSLKSTYIKALWKNITDTIVEVYKNTFEARVDVFSRFLTPLFSK
jgi:hypothetical protein